MEEYREEVVRRVPVDRVEERVVEEVVPDSRVVRTVSVPTPAAEVVTERRVVPTRTVRRWSWRRRTVPPAPVYAGPPVSTTEVYTAPTYALDPTLSQFLRVVWFLLGVLEVVLALRFLLALFGANPRNAFAMLVYGVTYPFAGPFQTLFPQPAAGGSVFEGGTLIAMAVYFLLCWGIVKLIGVVTNRWVDV